MSDLVQHHFAQYKIRHYGILNMVGNAGHLNIMLDLTEGIFEVTYSFQYQVIASTGFVFMSLAKTEQTNVKLFSSRNCYPTDIYHLAGKCPLDVTQHIRLMRQA